MADSPAALPRLETGLLTNRVLDALVQAIDEGQFEGGKLPNENALSELLGVSRTTTRRALQSLEQIGMVSRRPGRGTRLRKRVTPEVLTVHGLVPFASLLERRGDSVLSESSMEMGHKVSDEVAARLGPVDPPLYEIHRVFSANGRPVVAIHETIPADVLIRPLDEEDVQLGSIIKLDPRAFHMPIDYAVALLVPRVARTGVRIAVEPGEPYLMLQETFYSSDDDAIAISDVSVHPQEVPLSVFRKALL
jgi:GntR family transcriptional regulator